MEGGLGGRGGGSYEWEDCGGGVERRTAGGSGGPEVISACGGFTRSGVFFCSFFLAFAEEGGKVNEVLENNFE